MLWRKEVGARRGGRTFSGSRGCSDDVRLQPTGASRATPRTRSRLALRLSKPLGRPFGCSDRPAFRDDLCMAYSTLPTPSRTLPLTRLAAPNSCCLGLLITSPSHCCIAPGTLVTLPTRWFRFIQMSVSNVASASSVLCLGSSLAPSTRRRRAGLTADTRGMNRHDAHGLMEV